MNIKPSHLIALSTLAALGAAGSAFAQGFTPIVPLPFPVTDSTSIGQYLDGLFKLSISLGAALAVGSIVMGGFQYVASEVLGDKAKGRSRIQNAVVGLILLLSVYLILNVINPQILELDIFGKSGSASIPGASTSGGATGSGGTTGPLPFPSGSLPGSTAGGQAIQDITNQGTPDVNIQEQLTKSQGQSIVNGAPTLRVGFASECTPTYVDPANGVQYTKLKQYKTFSYCTLSDTRVRACCEYGLADVPAGVKAGVVLLGTKQNPATPSEVSACGTGLFGLASYGCYFKFTNVQSDICPLFATYGGVAYQRRSDQYRSICASSPGAACCYYDRLSQ